MMPEKSHNNDNAKTAKSKGKRIWLAAIVAALTVIIACTLWSLRNSKSIDQQLAEIEAARAIPDSQNAAIIYNKLMQNPTPTSLVNWPQLTNRARAELESKPWRSEKYPKIAVWIKQKQPVIDELLAASKYDKCRFPIVFPLPPNRTMTTWAFLLRHAANNDIGDGRIDDAIGKWLCLLKMGHHLRQQPLFGGLMFGMANEGIALNQIEAFLVQGNPEEAHLRKIESLPLYTEDNWAAVLEEITPAEELAEGIYKSQMGFIERIKYTFGYDDSGRIYYPTIPKIRRRYHVFIARSRGIHVLVALRRYKNKHGRWPESLDQIKAQVPEEIFLDPFGNALAYKLTDEAFTLYSKGPNKIDENGKRTDPCDDCPIWVPPAQKQEAKQQNADPNQPETIKQPN